MGLIFDGKLLLFIIHVNFKELITYHRVGCNILRTFSLLYINQAHLKKRLVGFTAQDLPEDGEDAEEFEFCAEDIRGCKFCPLPH